MPQGQYSISDIDPPQGTGTYNLSDITPDLPTPTAPYFRQDLIQAYRAQNPSARLMTDNQIFAAIAVQNPKLAQGIAELTGAVPPSPPPPPPTTVAGQINQLFQRGGNTINDLLTGGTQEAARRIMQGGNLIRQIPGVGPALNALPSIEVAPQTVTPQNPTQQAGARIERAAEFLLPSAVTGPVETALTKAYQLGTLERLGLQAGLETGSAFGVSKAQADPNALQNALVAGGLTAAGSLALKTLGALGQSTELRVLKPYASVLEDVRGAAPGQEGKKLVSDIYRYNLGGTLDQSLQKTSSMLSSLDQQLKTVLQSNPAATVDLDHALSQVTRQLHTPEAIARNSSQNEAINRVLAQKLQELNTLDKFGATRNGQANLDMANLFKRSVGDEGAWVNGFADPDNQARQIVANALYKQLRQQIETAAGNAAPAIQAINQQMADLQPIRQALINRIPVASRREILSLKEAMGLARGNLPGFALAASDRLLRSPALANRLVQGAQAASQITPRLGQLGAGIFSELQQPPGPQGPVGAGTGNPIFDYLQR